MKKQKLKNKLSNMKGSKGITLIALIITIIVLLILAVVAISSVNNTGIVQYAQNSKAAYIDGSDEEDVTLQNYMDIINHNDPNKKDDSNVPDKLVKYLFGDSQNGREYLKELSGNGQDYKANTALGIAEGDVKALNYAVVDNEIVFYIEYKEEKYKFKTDINEDELPNNTIPTYGVVRIDDWNEDSRVGKYVEDENGDTWRIIYDDDIHGLQMISSDIFENKESDKGTFTLGSSFLNENDWNALNTTTSEFKVADLNKDGKLEDIMYLERAIYSYNQAIETLNSLCENLFKENGSYTRTYIQDVRCVGSNPVFANKNSENTTPVTSDIFPLLETLPKNNANQAAGLCNGVGYGIDNNFESDFDRIMILGINETTEGYWMASRYVYMDEDKDYGKQVRFAIRGSCENNLYSSDLWTVSETHANGHGSSDTLRPVVLLNSNIQFSEGEGTEDSPYKF